MANFELETETENKIMNIESFFENEVYEDYHEHIRMKFNKYVNKVFCQPKKQLEGQKRYHEIVTIDYIDWYILYTFDKIYCHYPGGKTIIINYSEYSFKVRHSNQKTKNSYIKNIVKKEILRKTKELKELEKKRDELYDEDHEVMEESEEDDEEENEEDDKEENEEDKKKRDDISESIYSCERIIDCLKTDYTDYLKYKLCKGDILTDKSFINFIPLRKDIYKRKCKPITKNDINKAMKGLCLKSWKRKMQDVNNDLLYGPRDFCPFYLNNLSSDTWIDQVNDKYEKVKEMCEPLKMEFINIDECQMFSFLVQTSPLGGDDDDDDDHEHYDEPDYEEEQKFFARQDRIDYHSWLPPKPEEDVFLRYNVEHPKLLEQAEMQRRPVGEWEEDF